MLINFIYNAVGIITLSLAWDSSILLAYL